MAYQAEGIPLLILAGKEYGTGSSRDWAAKGTTLLGVKAVLAESFERIHRSNLVGMGVLPLQFGAGESAESLGPDGTRNLRRDRDPRPAGARWKAHGAGPSRMMGPLRSSTWTCAWIPGWRSSTTRMVEFSTPSCGRWPRARCSLRVGGWRPRWPPPSSAGLLAGSFATGRGPNAFRDSSSTPAPGAPVEGALVLLLDEGGGGGGRAISPTRPADSPPGSRTRDVHSHGPSGSDIRPHLRSLPPRSRPAVRHSTRNGPDRPSNWRELRVEGEPAVRGSAR